MIHLIDSLKQLFRREDKSLYSALYHILGFYPRDIEYYRIAFAHKSQQYRSRKDDKPLNNERLEFLGDAILEAVSSDIIYHRFPNKREGFLTNTRSKLVQRETLGKLAADLGIEALVKSHTRSSAHNSYLGGNAFEALIGAIYLDRGYQKTFEFIEKRIVDRAVNLEQMAQKEVNFKSKLLEWSQKNRIQIDFRLESGTNAPQGDDPTFYSVVVLEDIVAGKGKGYSKKESQQEAAKEALTKMRRDSRFTDAIFRSKEKRTAMEAQEFFVLPPIEEIDEAILQEQAAAAAETTAKRRHDKNARAQRAPKAPKETTPELKLERVEPKPERPEKSFAKPEKKDSKPEKVDSKPEKVDSKSEKKDTKPEKVDSKPEKPAPKPAPTTSPALSATEEAPEAKPERTEKKERKSERKEQHPVKKERKPEPRAENLEPRAEKSEPRAEKSESRAEKSEPRAEKPEPRAEKSEPRAEKLESRAEKSEPRAEKSEPRAEKSEPRAEKSDPRAEKPELRAEKSEPRAEKSEPRDAKSEHKAESAEVLPAEGAPAAQQTPNTASPLTAVVGALAARATDTAASEVPAEGEKAEKPASRRRSSQRPRRERKPNTEAQPEQISAQEPAEKVEAPESPAAKPATEVPVEAVQPQRPLTFSLLRDHKEKTAQ